MIGKRLWLTLLVAAAGLAIVAAAPARDDDEVAAARRCTAGSTVKLSAKPDDGRLETELEVDQNRVGQRWRVVLKRNGRIAFQATRRTRPPSGSFEVERRLADGAGADRIAGDARNLRTGERCRIAVSI